MSQSPCNGDCLTLKLIYRVHEDGKNMYLMGYHARKLCF